MRTGGSVIRVFKWTILVAALVTMTLWLLSGWWGVGWLSQTGLELQINKGGLQAIEWAEMLASHVPGPMVYHNGYGLTWLPSRFNGPFATWSFMPLWPIALPLALAAWLLWRTDVRGWRRHRAGLCSACGYDLRGFAPGSKCSECGHTVPPPRQATLSPRRRRIEHVLKESTRWAGAPLAICLVALCLESRSCYLIRFSESGAFIGIGRGYAYLGINPADNPQPGKTDWIYSKDPATFPLRMEACGAGSVWETYLPLWFPAMLAVGTSAVVWTSDARRTLRERARSRS